MQSKKKLRGGMRVPFFQVDAFAEGPFSGNPAAVCVLEAWLDDWLLAAIAAENNLSETAFLVAWGDDFELRWFTPTVEVDLCGHATLASAFVVLERLTSDRDAVVFHTRRCGALTVSRGDANQFTLDFPSRPASRLGDDEIDLFAEALGARPTELWAARDHVALFSTEREVAALRPDFDRVLACADHAIIATAPGDSADVDFVSRFFGPAVGVPEDPVTGSAHATLTPFWADRLGKTELHARQISARGGSIHCRLDNDRVHLTGRAVLVIEGTMFITADDTPGRSS